MKVGGPVTRRKSSEADVSTERTPPVAAARFSKAHEQPRREGRSAGPTPQGPPEAVSLIWRIRNSATFGRLHRDGLVARHGLLEIRYLLGGEDPPRLAFSVGRRVGPAVARNRVRRRLRAVMRNIAASAPERLPSGDYLVRVRPGAAEADTGRLRHDVGAALERIRRRGESA